MTGEVQIDFPEFLEILVRFFLGCRAEAGRGRGWADFNLLRVARVGVPEAKGSTPVECDFENFQRGKEIDRFWSARLSRSV